METHACDAGGSALRVEAHGTGRVGFASRVPIRQVKRAAIAMTTPNDGHMLAEPVPINSPLVKPLGEQVLPNREESTNNDCYLSILNGCLETEKEGTVVCG